jgi:predicted RNA binding protein YcfA (HicA-like mRNA interferase family)
MRIYLRMLGLETSRSKIVARLERDGWQGHAGGRHDVFKHPARPGQAASSCPVTLSPGVARALARAAGWKDRP